SACVSGAMLAGIVALSHGAAAMSQPIPVVAWLRVSAVLPELATGRLSERWPSVAVRKLASAGTAATAARVVRLYWRLPVNGPPCAAAVPSTAFSVNGKLPCVVGVPIREVPS